MMDFLHCRSRKNTLKFALERHRDRIKVTVTERQILLINRTRNPSSAKLNTVQRIHLDQNQTHSFIEEWLISENNVWAELNSWNEGWKRVLTNVIILTASILSPFPVWWHIGLSMTSTSSYRRCVPSGRRSIYLVKLNRLSWRRLLLGVGSSRSLHD